MEVKVASTCFQLSKPIPHSSCYSQTLASIISSPSSTRRSPSLPNLRRLALFGTPLMKFQRSRSCCSLKPRIQTITRACSSSLNEFSDEEFSKQIQELSKIFEVSDEKIDDRDDDYVENTESASESSFSQTQITPSLPNPWPEIYREPPGWTRENEMIIDEVARKANSVDFPLSLRVLKRKFRWERGIKSARDSAYCSVKKAFSSMVFMIRELHSYSLKLREILFYEDLQGILNRVEKEMQDSFVWLFQQVFSHTPTLMVYVMILLANFTVHSMGNNTAIAASSPPESLTEIVHLDNRKINKFDSSAIKTFSVSSSRGKTASIGGGNGGGKTRPAANGTHGDGSLDRSVNYGTVIPDEVSQLSSFGTLAETESNSGEIAREEETHQWNWIVEEASKMKGEVGKEANFVSPVKAKMESEDYTEYFRTELLYQTILAQDPNNPLLLANFAQFLYLVAHDFDRAEYYFSKAVGEKPADAEAWSKYATFTWKARKDLWGAEERFLEAITVEPENTFHASNYAYFLWTSGGADGTCFPLSSNSISPQDA